MSESVFFSTNSYRFGYSNVVQTVESDWLMAVGKAFDPTFPKCGQRYDTIFFSRMVIALSQRKNASASIY